MSLQSGSGSLVSRSGWCPVEFVVERDLDQLGPVSIFVCSVYAEVCVREHSPWISVNYGRSVVDAERYGMVYVSVKLT